MREVSVRGDARDVTLLMPVRRANAAAITMLPYAPGGEDGFALITVSPPARNTARATPRDVTLVLDVSGSMQGRKIEQARAAGRQLLATLRPEDRFRLIDFSTDVHTFRDDMVSATDANVRDASKYLDELEANGGTNIEGALREALRSPAEAGRLPIVLFITDGEPTVGEQRPGALVDIAKEQGGGRGAEGGKRRIFTFGLGSDVNASLLEQMALDGGGTAQFVRPDESVEREVGIVASRIVDPMMTNVRVRAEGGVQLSKALPSAASDIFAGRDLVMMARYSGHGPARIVVDGRQGTENVQWTSQVDFPERDRANAFVARLWATQRVGWLSAERRRAGASSELDDEIKSLGERYAIPTEFTSYLVQEPRVMTAGLGNGGMGMAAPAPQVQAFEQAKAASAARAATSMSAVDAMMPAQITSVHLTGSTSAIIGRRVVANRIFTLRDGVWTDERYRTGGAVTAVKPYSNAYFALLDKIPELRAVFAIGDRVIVAGRGVSIEVSEKGVESLDSASVERISKEF
jgi:Ca-activated chloride channel family protein